MVAGSRSITPADINLTATVMKPKRISGQVIVSRRLLIQSTGAIPLDEFIASQLKTVFASRLDQAALYGRGSAQNEPTGVVSATGSQAVTVSNPPVWADLAQMRFASTNFGDDRDSFSWITNPRGRKYFESTARFATGSSASLWDLMQREAEVSDDRVLVKTTPTMSLLQRLLTHER
jgi:HK97 family phage major capsid protein